MRIDLGLSNHRSSVIQRIPQQGIRFGNALTREEETQRLLKEQFVRSPLVRSPEWERRFSKAKQYILERKKVAPDPQHPGIVILDVDDTVLNYDEGFASRIVDFEFTPDGQIAFIFKKGEPWQMFKTEDPPPFLQTREFIGWLNANEIPYCFLTGRREEFRSKMETDLQRAGVLGSFCQGLLMRSNAKTVEPTPEFKAQQRDKLEQKYGEVLANVGDQLGDLFDEQDPRNVSNVPLPGTIPIKGRAQNQVY